MEISHLWDDFRVVLRWQSWEVNMQMVSFKIGKAFASASTHGSGFCFDLNSRLCCSRPRSFSPAWRTLSPAFSVPSLSPGNPASLYLHDQCLFSFQSHLLNLAFLTSLGPPSISFLSETQSSLVPTPCFCRSVWSPQPQVLAFQQGNYEMPGRASAMELGSISSVREQQFYTWLYPALVDLTAASWGAKRHWPPFPSCHVF